MSFLAEQLKRGISIIVRMRVLLCCLLSASLAVGVTAGNDLVAADGGRYVGVWTDGSQAAADEVLDWGRSDGRPALAGRLLFDPKNPVRSLEDTTLPRRTPLDRYLEFRGGDRLPGRVVKFVDADPATAIPAHLVFEPAGDLGLPQVFSRSEIRLLPDWVRQIVNHADSGVSVPPKTLRIAGGGNVPFQESRWRENGVQALTDSGVKSFQFEDISTLHFGPWNPWDAWRRQLAVLSPGIDSRLARLELADGTRFTVSLERLRPRTLGGDDANRWYQLLQPAWSLDLLAVPHRKIRTRTFFGPEEVPLSAVEPAASRHRAIFSQAWGTARFDENVRGDRLRAGDRDFAWGFGVHAHHELEFELPVSALTFRTKLGLDPWVGPGGCARGRVQLAERVLFESPLLVGTAPALECGPVPVRGGARLVLIADADAGKRPQGADPFDIRDIFNWLEPLVELAPAELRREIEPHQFGAQPLLASWTPDPAEAPNWRLVNRFDDTETGSPVFRQLLLLDAPITFSRQVPVDPKRPTALLQFGRPGNRSVQAKFEISINGRRVLRDVLPGPTPSPEPLQILVPLKTAAGKSIDFTLRLDPAGQSALVDWRGLTFVRDGE
jgi:hypothetical protein